MRVITLREIDSELEMFDYTTDTQTETANVIEEEFDCSGCNSVTILNTYGISATLSVVDDSTSTEYYTATVSLVRDSIKDWWDYWFAPCRTGKDIVFYFEAKASSTATITISYPDGTAKCGFCKPGVATECGNTLYGIEVGISDYSIVDTDEFGSTFFAVGSWAKRASGNVKILNTSLDLVTRKMVENRGVGAVFDFNEYADDIEDGHTSDSGLQSLIIYGYPERFSPEISRPVSSEYGLEVQGLI